eukprot:ANDGO_04803.mRNA.1 DNA mismatch repair protein msh6
MISPALDQKQNHAYMPQQSPRLSHVKSARSSLSFGSPPSAQKVTLAQFDKESRKVARAEDFAQRNENRYGWLEKRLDAERRPTSDPEFDPRTLYIPPGEFRNLAPFEQQYWSIKREHMDVIIFFKKGKFYELYEGDADIGHKEFDLKMTDRVNMRMAGVPESSFEFWASKLVAKGYKVGRVEQMEPAKAAAAKAGPSSKPKICERQLCQILTSGTLTELDMMTSEEACYLMCLTFEGDLARSSGASFGITVVDVSRGCLFLRKCTSLLELETVFLQLMPRELLVEKQLQSQLSLLKSQPVLISERKPQNEMGKLRMMEAYPDVFQHPVVQRFLSVNVVLESLTSTLAYLKELMLDQDLVSMNRILEFSAEIGECDQSMIIDGQTLLNLEVFQNSLDGTASGTLFSVLNNCSSPGGARLLRRWVSHPLSSVAKINARLDAVEELKDDPRMRSNLMSALRRLPDIERLLGRIHSFSRKKSKDVYMVDNVDEKRRATFMQLLNGLSVFTVAICELLDDSVYVDGHSQLISDLLNQRNAWEAIQVSLDSFKAMAQNPESYDEFYCEKLGFLENVEEQLEQHLQSLQKRFKDSSISFRSMGKELYQVEISRKTVDRNQIPPSFEQISSTKEVVRYWTPEIKKLLEVLENAKEASDAALRQSLASVFSKFMESSQTWLHIFEVASTFDALCSLAVYSANIAPACRPQLLDGASTEPVLLLRQMRHPMMIRGASHDFVPNDLLIGGRTAPCMLLTGPNMGGKSTQLRLSCYATLLSQIGCFVPAESCLITPADRIFTRLGATDRIMHGMSTFHVELDETAVILKHATRNSVVILDELGRGTSTFDGYAIAHSVLNHLANEIGCRTLFCTHYHMLTAELAFHPNVSSYHMACRVDDSTRSITFLYQLLPGSCPKSYGLHVALHAGIPKEIVENAERVAEVFESETVICSTNQVSALRNFLENAVYSLAS